MSEENNNLILSSFVFSIISIVSNLFIHLKLKHCHSACMDADCIPTKTPPQSPQHKDIENEILTII